MLTLSGLQGSYQLDDSQPQKGKFGTILFGTRLSDGTKITAKRIAPPANEDESRKLELIASLNHRNLAQTIEIIKEEDVLYLIRKYEEGSSFKTIFKRNAINKHLPANFYIKAVTHLLEGLDSLHRAGLVHRDIKPSNIIIRHDENVKPQNWNPEDVVLIDFEQASTFPVTRGTRAPFSLVYSPPEQLLNHTWLIGPWSDLFALTVTLYEVLTGSAPWVDCNAEILMNLQLTYPMKRPSRIDEQLFTIMERAAYKERFPLPPRRLAPEVIEEVLKAGIEKRSANAMTYRQELLSYLQTHTDKPKTLWLSRLFGTSSGC
jgi:serine/threonine protein kinase